MFLKRLTPDSVVIGAPAKINLFLEVLGKRHDGYHNINSLFQAVSLFDRLTFTKCPWAADLPVCPSHKNGQTRTSAAHKTAGIKTTLSPTGEITNLDCGPDNLIAKAYRAVQKSYPDLGGVAVTLEKNIPTAAGLGGGSSDAAATVLALNDLYELNMPQNLMVEIGLSVGSDIPFFFTKGQAIVNGRGETCTPVQLPIDYWVVLVTAGTKESTASAYRALSERGLTNPKPPFMLTSCQSARELVLQLKLAGNDFEKIHPQFYPELASIKDELLRCGALLARMSGSGPAVVGLFADPPPAGIDAIGNERGWRIHTVRPIVFSGT